MVTNGEASITVHNLLQNFIPLTQRKVGVFLGPSETPDITPLNNYFGPTPKRTEVLKVCLQATTKTCVLVAETLSESFDAIGPVSGMNGLVSIESKSIEILAVFFLAVAKVF